MHLTRCLQQLRSKDKNIEKYIYLAQLKDADPNMFYRVCVGNMAVSLSPPSPSFLVPPFSPLRLPPLPVSAEGSRGAAEIGQLGLDGTRGR